MAKKPHGRRSRERLRQAAWSGVIALVLSYFGMFEPLDQILWSLQARLAGFEASGDIVFVGTEAELTDPAYPHRREELAKAVDRLREAGARSLYVDMAFEQPSRPESDRALNSAMRRFGPQAHLIRNITTGFGNDSRALEQDADAIGRGVAQVGGERIFYYFGIVWTMPYAVQFEGTALESAAVSMARTSARPGEHFPINYGFRLDTIPMARLESINDSTPAELLARFGGKQVVIGKVGPDARFAIPGHAGVPGGLLHIFAAESLKAGYIRSLDLFHLLFAGLAVLLLATCVERTSVRRACYLGLALSVPACTIITMRLGILTSVSGLAVLQLVYHGFRLRARWTRSVLLVDQETGLPTFAALESDRQVSREHPTIIVARIHRFEEVRQSLAVELHAEYLLKITERLNAAAPETRIYLGPSRELAWCTAEDDQALVKDHLEGLRALFASPLRVGGEQVDVGITFGVDISPSRDVTRRLANAVAAAERTTETYLPILIAEAKSDEELIWNISLQARIDAALAQNEIFLVYQPKIRTDSGEMIGMEALVRWRDPLRGLIPPDSFIKQCEETGRMGHLTRHVLREACLAGVATELEGARFSIAVNISATLLHDRAIVAMVREVLEETGFDPHRLTLEITETYRISDMHIAGVNLRELIALGTSISMDDFGVGAASLEALLRLPFAELKIDRVFVDGLDQNPRALGIVRSILELGRQLRIKVVAEGVEDDATLDLLRQAGCPLAQGFGICRPVPLEEAVQFWNTTRKTNIQLSV